jgi:hypothetical protein
MPKAGALKSAASGSRAQALALICALVEFVSDGALHKHLGSLPGTGKSRGGDLMRARPLLGGSRISKSFIVQRFSASSSRRNDSRSLSLMSLLRVNAGTGRRS